MNCPRCNSILVVSNTQGVEIDHCPGCRGVWLDRGELEKIIERSNTYGPAAMTGNGYSNQHSDHHGDHHDKHYDKHHDNQYEYGHQPRHKKGFLSDLFDF